MGLILGLVGVVILAGWLIWDGSFAAPKKADFAAAKTIADDLEQGTARLDSSATAYIQAIVASLRTDPSGKAIEDDAADVHADYDAALKQQADLLKKLEGSAAARDDEVKTAIGNVKTEVAAARKFFVDFTGGYDGFYRTYISCDDVTRFVASADAARTAAEFGSAAKDCIKDLDTLSKADTLKSAKDYASKRRDIVSTQRRAYDDLAKAGADTKVLTATLASLKDQTRMLDPLGDLQKERSEAIATPAAIALTKLLDTKSR